MIARHYADKISIIYEPAAEFIALQVDYGTAKALLLARGLPESGAERVLNEPVSDRRWRAAHAAAAAATAKAVEEALGNAASVEEVKEVRTSVERLQEQVEDDRHANELHAREAERLALETYVRSEADRIIEASVKQLGERSRIIVTRKAWEAVWNSPSGRRLAELREAP